MLLSSFPKIIYNYSTEHMFYLWTPPKTGSNHATFIFNHFNFYSKIYRKSDQELLFDHNQKLFIHCHQYITLPEHTDYKIICTARNPYSSIYSFFNHAKKLDMYYNLGDINFKDFVLNNTEPNSETNIRINKMFEFLFKEVEQEKKPDYFIKLESLYEDYLKIPFVNGSKLHTSGILEELCLNKINTTQTNFNFSDFIDQELQDYISTKYSNYFDLIGYPKIVL
jgi:hypothetical protein